MTRKIRTRAMRGASLLVAMIIIVMMTLLVAGSIVLTGTERSAAANQTRTEVSSACVQAARNLFLSKVRLLSQNITGVVIDQTFPHSDGKGATRIRTGHMTGAPTTLLSVEKLPPDRIGGKGTGPGDLTNRLGSLADGLGGAYAVSAVCQDVVSGAEQEVEFVIKLGL